MNIQNRDAGHARSLYTHVTGRQICNWLCGILTSLLSFETAMIVDYL